MSEPTNSDIIRHFDEKMDHERRLIGVEAKASSLEDQVKELKSDLRDGMADVKNDVKEFRAESKAASLGLRSEILTELSDLKKTVKENSVKQPIWPALMFILALIMAVIAFAGLLLHGAK